MADNLHLLPGRIAAISKEVTARLAPSTVTTICNSYPAGFSEGKVIACNIHHFLGMVVHDSEFNSQDQRPKILLVTEKWEACDLRLTGVACVEELCVDVRLALHVPRAPGWKALHTLRLSACVSPRQQERRWQRHRRRINDDLEPIDLLHLPLEQIKTLALKGEYFTSIEHVDVVGARLALTSFELLNTNFSAEHTNQLLKGSLRSLTNLQLTSASSCFDVRRIVDFPNLQSLRMRSSNTNVVKTLGHIAKSDIVLERLCIIELPQVRLPAQLTHLSIYDKTIYSAEITATMMCTMLAQCPHLQVLDIRGCNIKNAGYTYLADHLPIDLRILQVGGEIFTDSRLLFVAGCPSLDQDDRTYSRMIEEDWPSLSQAITFLDLKGNTCCTQQALHQFLEACPNVTAIDIRHSLISPKSLSGKELRNLHSVYCESECELALPGLIHTGACDWDIMTTL